MPLHAELPLSAQTAYAQLADVALGQALGRGIAHLHGSFSSKKVQGVAYWYFAFRDLDGRVRQLYVGPDNEAVRAAIRARTPLVLFGSYNERMYLSEIGARAVYIPASFPGAVIRRHTGTPFMGYAGATYIVQEVCNALFDALFHILPLATDMDRGEATPARLADGAADSAAQTPWDDAAHARLQAIVALQPVLVQISAARRLRDGSERAARQAGASTVEASHVNNAGRELGLGVPA